jgi:hypothetical protein
LIPPSSSAKAVPQMNEIGYILAEAGSLVIAYQNLDSAAFSPLVLLPTIGPPMILPMTGIVYRAATISAHKFVERIINQKSPTHKRRDEL